MTWSVEGARALAESCLTDSWDRWLHVQGVSQQAAQLRVHGLDVSEAVVGAAWLHDVGYAAPLNVTGFHALDGARWLALRGVPNGIVSLVAYHSGAGFEAEERGLVNELAEFSEPDVAELDVLTLVDMTVGPSGQRICVDERFVEILNRYAEHDPVHRAVTRARPHLQASAARAADRLGLADVRTRAPI